MKKLIDIAVSLVALIILAFFAVRIYQETIHLSGSPVFTQAKQEFPHASWTAPRNAENSTFAYGVLKGKETIGSFKGSGMGNIYTIRMDTGKDLSKLGFTDDQSFSADGVDGSQWGYIKIKNGEKQAVIYNYKIEIPRGNPNEPLQVHCPCSTTITVFVSNPFKDTKTDTSQTLANPASVNCAKVGGTTLIENGPNGQYGLCDFGDNMQCEEWALYRGQCPVGGVKTTGFDTIEQKYCAWVGGQTYAVPNAKCKLPGGKTCSDTALYNGSCAN